MDGSGTRVALVTGASSGIGRAVSLELARRGFKLGLMARRAKELEDVARAIADGGGEAAVSVADVTDRAAVEAGAAAVEARFRRIDLLVASAGIGMPHIPRQEVFNTDAAEKTLRVNLLGVVYAIGAVLPGMLARGSGHLAAISSLVAYRGFPRAFAYTASKAGVNSLLESLRLDLLDRGVAVTVVNAGFVDTPLSAKNKGPRPFLVDPETAARTIADGLERRRRAIEFPLPLVAATRISRALVPDWLYERFVAGRSF